MGCYCLQYTVTPSIDPWHHDSPAVCSCHPATTCVATHAMTPRSHFSARQSSASHGKGIVYAIFLTFFGLPDPQVYFQSSISGIIWDGELDIQ
ncbi:hypothetical protein TNCV_4148371 [Trichonephila clavipes]|nr:hypothetical protein TNCV_4148371 [Trichonephila clavipes]